MLPPPRAFPAPSERITALLEQISLAGAGVAVSPPPG